MTIIIPERNTVNCVLIFSSYLGNIFNVHPDGHVCGLALLGQLELHVHGRDADPHLLAVRTQHVLVDLGPGRLQQQADHRDQDQPEPATAREGKREAAAAEQQRDSRTTAAAAAADPSCGL